MKLVRGILILILSLFSVQAAAIGLGVVVAGPTGLTAKNYLTNERALDFALAWNNRSDEKIYFHTNYLVHNDRIFRGREQGLYLYYGVGLQLIALDPDEDDKDQDEFSAGPRFPLGLSYRMPFEKNIEVFGELALTLGLIGETNARFNGAIGGRFYF